MDDQLINNTNMDKGQQIKSVIFNSEVIIESLKPHYMDSCTIAGCAIGPDDFITVWTLIKPFVEICQLAIPVTVALIKFITYMKHKNDKTIGEIFEEVLDKESWKVDEFSTKYGFSNEESKKILQGFLYKWDKHKQSYNRSIDNDKIIKILQNSNKYIIK